MRCHPFLAAQSLSDDFLGMLGVGRARRGAVVRMPQLRKVEQRHLPAWMSSVDLTLSQQASNTGTVAFSAAAANGSPAPVKGFSQSNPLVKRSQSRSILTKKSSSNVLMRSASAKQVSASGGSLDKARALASLALQSSAIRVIDYNRLESTFVMTAMFVLLSGMVFNSTAFANGSPPYILMTVIVCGIIICTVLAFVGLITFEVYRAIRYSGLHAVARTIESATIELRLLNAGKTAGDGSSRLLRADSSKRGKVPSSSPARSELLVPGVDGISPPPPPPIPPPPIASLIRDASEHDLRVVGSVNSSVDAGITAPVHSRTTSLHTSALSGSKGTVSRPHRAKEAAFTRPARSSPLRREYSVRLSQSPRDLARDRVARMQKPPEE